MNTQSWLLFLHILGATVWIGAGVALWLNGLRVRRSADWCVVADFAKSLRYIGPRAFIPSIGIVLASGILMVLTAPVWKTSQFWVLIGLAMFLIAFLVGAVYLRQIGIALETTVTKPGRDLGKATALVGRWSVGYGAILFALLVAVWDMVFKPFS